MVIDAHLHPAGTGKRREGIFQEFVSFVSHDRGNPIWETTMQYAILKKVWQ